MRRLFSSAAKKKSLASQECLNRAKSHKAQPRLFCGEQCELFEILKCKWERTERAGLGCATSLLVLIAHRNFRFVSPRNGRTVKRIYEINIPSRLVVAYFFCRGCSIVVNLTQRHFSFLPAKCFSSTLARARSKITTKKYSLSDNG
jgi:hypothetical protein